MKCKQCISIGANIRSRWKRLFASPSPPVEQPHWGTPVWFWDNVKRASRFESDSTPSRPAISTEDAAGVCIASEAGRALIHTATKTSLEEPLSWTELPSLSKFIHVREFQCGGGPVYQEFDNVHELSEQFECLTYTLFQWYTPTVYRCNETTQYINNAINNAYPVMPTHDAHSLAYIDRTSPLSFVQSFRLCDVGVPEKVNWRLHELWIHHTKFGWYILRTIHSKHRVYFYTFFHPHDATVHTRTVLDHDIFLEWLSEWRFVANKMIFTKYDALEQVLPAFDSRLANVWSVLHVGF